MNEWLPYLALAVSVLICLTGVYVAWRAGRWRDSDEAKELHNRVTSLETNKEVVEGRLDAMGLILQDLPTKAAFAELKGSVDGLEREFSTSMRSVSRQLTTQERGIERIEQHLLGSPK